MRLPCMSGKVDLPGTSAKHTPTPIWLVPVRTRLAQKSGCTDAKATPNLCYRKPLIPTK
ncbi:MAG: hypothetical protein RI907_3409 [Pseudomonadota bacterium]